jgi:hypothetical protein
MCGHIFTRLSGCEKCEASVGLWRRSWDSAAVYQPTGEAARAVIVSSSLSESCVVQMHVKSVLCQGPELVAVAEVVGHEAHQGATWRGFLTEVAEVTWNLGYG